MYGDSDSKGCAMIFFGLILMIPVLIWVGVRSYNDICFGRNCEGYLKRAADANTVDIAKVQLKKAVDYIEANKMTEGYTSIFYTTPDEDVGFWYNNLRASLGELEKVNAETTQLERSNVLMKLRETLLDQGDKGMSITVPDGITVFPNNIGYCVWGTVSAVIAIIGCIIGFLGINSKWLR